MNFKNVATYVYCHLLNVMLEILSNFLMANSTDTSSNIEIYIVWEFEENR